MDIHLHEEAEVRCTGVHLTLWVSGARSKVVVSSEPGTKTRTTTIEKGEKFEEGSRSLRRALRSKFRQYRLFASSFLMFKMN